MTYILGGYQTDFARNWTKEGKHIAAMIREAVEGALAETGVEPRDVDRVMGFGFHWAPPGLLADFLGLKRTVTLLEVARLPVPRVLVDAAERRQPLFAEPHVDRGRFFFAGGAA